GACQPAVRAQCQRALARVDQGRRAGARLRRRGRQGGLRHTRRRHRERGSPRRRGGTKDRMTTELEIGLYIFILAGFLGYHVITRVPPLLHTPLMSATNAISGISLIGSLVVAGANYSRLSTVLGFIAVTCSSTNVVGGFLITDRMLKMFKRREEVGIQSHRFNPKLVLAFPVLVVAFLGVMHWIKPS